MAERAIMYLMRENCNFVWGEPGEMRDVGLYCLLVWSEHTWAQRDWRLREGDRG